jgi:hypothetical protein
MKTCLLLISGVPVCMVKDPPFILENYILGFYRAREGCFGLFRFVTKQICLFRLFRYRFETPKQTEIFSFWFHETNRNKRETDLVSVCFGSNRKIFLFVSRTPYMKQSIYCYRRNVPHSGDDLCACGDLSTVSKHPQFK